MVLYICLFQNIIFASMPEDDFGTKLKASEKLKKMFFLALLNTYTVTRSLINNRPELQSHCYKALFVQH